VLGIALYLVVNRTRLGMMIRAGASNRDMVRGLGVDITRLYRIVFAGGVALAALAGMIAAPMSSVYPGMGGHVLIISFVVVVIGGIGSISGALVASLLVGVVDTFGKVFFAELSGIGVYLLMAVILVWRPEGLMKRVTATEVNRTVPWIAPGRIAGTAAVLTPYTHDLVVKIMVLSVFALSLELLVGMTGLVSLGHAAFLGLGAYVTVLLSPEADPGNLLKLLACAAVGGGRGLCAVRRRAEPAHQGRVLHHGHAGLCADGLLRVPRHQARRRHRRHLPQRAPGAGGPLDAGDKLHLYYLALAALALTYGGLALLRRSRFGHALAGIRVNEQRMRAAGFATYAYKLAAFVLSGALAGLAGFLLAVKDGFVNPELLSWHESGAVLLMIILGGIGHLRGAVIGATAFVLLKELYATAGAGRPRAGRTLAADAGLHHHRLRGAAAQGADRAAPTLGGKPSDDAAVLRAPDAPLRRADGGERRDAGRSSWARCTP
jgi:branched-chain amino acid transport system permease protein